MVQLTIKMKHHSKTIQDLDESIHEAKEIVKRQNRRERVVIDNTTAIRELVIELNKEYGINTGNS